MISIADPNSRNALAVGSALVLIGRTGQWRTVFFVLAERAVGVIVASLVGIDAAIGKCSIASALELRTETGVRFAFHLVRPVAAIRLAVTQQRRMYAMSVAALELAGHAGESRAIGRFIRTISTIVLGVASPPERDAFVGGGADKLRRGTVVVTRHAIRCQDEVLRTSALASSAGFEQTQSRAIPVVGARIVIQGSLPQRMIDLTGQDRIRRVINRN